MMALFLFFLIQLLSGFFVILSIEYLKNPTGSLLRRSFDWSKAFVSRLFDKLSIKVLVWLGIFTVVCVLILLAIFVFHIELNPPTYKELIMIAAGAYIVVFNIPSKISSIFQEKEAEKKASKSIDGD